MLTHIPHALRTLRRDPRFVAAAVLPLALGLGAAMAVCSVAYGILLRPLPVQNERSLVVVSATDARHSHGYITHPRFQAWRESDAFQALAASTSRRFDIVSDGFAERVIGAAVAGDFFGVLGVQPLHGRALSPGEARADGIPAVISHPLWMRRFGGDPEVLGRTITSGSLHLMIVGVMPPGFERWRDERHVWVPVERVETPSVLTSEGYFLFTAVGRLHPETSRQATAERLAVVDAARDAALQEQGRRTQPPARLVALRDDVVAPGMRRALAVLLAAVALTWLVACANAANLLLARGTRRAAEIAVRMAIGASRGRIVRHLMIESVALAVPAGALGLLIAWLGTRLLVAYGPPGVIGNTTISVDLPIAAAAALLTAVSAALFGIVPAFRSSAVSLTRTLAERAAPRRLSAGLIGAQVAIAVVVLIGASVLVRSLGRMTAVDLGFEPHNVLTIEFSFPQKFPGSTSAEPQRAWRLATQDAMLARLGALPGVESVALTGSTFRPIGDFPQSVWLDDGRRFLNGDPDQRPFAPRQHVVTPVYFRLHGVRMLEGRDFTERDRFSASPVVIVNQTMARLLWPEESPIGRRVNFEGYSPVKGYGGPWHEIVGVVADMRYGGVDEPLRPEIYRAAAEEPLRGGYAVLKTSVRPERVAAQARDAIRDIDADIPIRQPRTLQDLVDESTAATRYNAALLSLCAALTTLLCGAGLYGLLAYGVAARRRELGIRIALGAAPRSIVRSVLRQAIWPVLIGLAAGLTTAWLSIGILSGLLFEVAPHDPLAFAAAAVLVTLVSLGAAWLPARRAARLDPVVALRAE
jgi:putative ABC transport system permease protein